MQATDAGKLSLIDTLADKARSGKVAVPSDFVRAFYRHVPPEDLLQRDPEQLLGAARSAWDLLQVRRAGRATVRLPDPNDPINAWCNGRTVVEIINDDMPYLVDSVTNVLNASGLLVNLVIHPVVRVERDASCRLVRLFPPSTVGAGAAESVMLVELEERVDAATADAVCQELRGVLADVRATVSDWPLMTSRAEAVAKEVTQSQVSAGEAAEVAAFLAWLTDGNFVFLGYREYRIEPTGIAVMPGNGLGLLRDETFMVFDGLRNLGPGSPVLTEFLQSPEVLTLSKSSRLSTVHRRAQMDTVSVKQFDGDGHPIGQKLFLGLFTSQSLSQVASAVPLLRRKVKHVTDRAGFAHDSHDGKALQHIIDTLPRDELFQFTEDELLTIAVGILNLQERQRLALFVRRDPFARFVSCFIFVPRDRYSAAVHRRMTAVLTDALGGNVLTEAGHADESALARMHVVIATPESDLPQIDLEAVEARLAEAARTWPDRLGQALADHHGGEPQDRGIADQLLRRYGEAFPGSYTEHVPAATAVADIARIESVLAGKPIDVAVTETGKGGLSLRTCHASESLALSDVLPLLENFGLRVLSELPFEIRPRGSRATVWVQEFEAVAQDGAELAPEPADLARLEKAIESIWAAEQESDGFNRLVLLAGLSARQVVILRAYCKVLRQAGSTFSQAYMEDTLARHPVIVRHLVAQFEAQFDPTTGDAPAVHESAIKEALDEVANLDEDRILRSFLLLVSKTLRTNYYQHDQAGQPKAYLSLKLASREIDLLPLPRPLVEVYVYSPWMEGCHLRGGRVARGGIRWSDRKEDFRTEILGLMKAQMVKNAVIVPVGSKGGFVVKRPPTTGGREALMAEVIRCYQTLMRGLLDITDTIGADGIVPPADVVRRDSDDPYLVVAADKGTATFSDIANGVSHDYGFWLDDAFASGGSVGYDHKVMGITARGAWEAVKRHFREIGVDCQTTDFTCIGVGDMSGDVFGNGMLLSKHTRLVAAFNHMHVFIDPDPDPAATWQERKRLFDLPRSGWNDYDTSTLSPGGGIYARASKSITLSPQAQAMLGLDNPTLTPAELVRTLLGQPVDLLWFGGIGTYVKAKTETAADAGDRANDTVRLNGCDLRAKIVGEGANLAVTQRGRIEFALAGGRINTDAIDNSAGVDTSDHEVNIKIGVGNLIASGHLAQDNRNTFLASMTETVGRLVLGHNYLQTQALSLAEAEAPALLDQHGRLMRSLERQGRLDRAVEFLPDDEAIGQRASLRRGLTRPELAVLLAYAKMALYDDLLGSDFPDDPPLESELLGYFPQEMVAVSAEAIGRHRLRREIIATVIANAIINRQGAGFIVEMQARTGRSAASIARAWLSVRAAFDLPGLWRDIEALDNRLPAATQTALLLAVQHVAELACRWLLQSGSRLDPATQSARLASGLATLGASMETLLPEAERAEQARRRAMFTDAGVDPALVNRVVALEGLGTALDVIGMDGDAAGTDDLPALGRIYFAAGERLGLLHLRRLAAEVPAATSWQRMASGALADDFAVLQRDIVQSALVQGQGKNTAGAPEDRLDRWMAQRPESIGKLQEILTEMRRVQPPELAMLVVAMRQLRTLAAS